MKIKISIIIISIYIALLFTGCFYNNEELLLTSTSPNNTYTIEAYKVNGGATVDFFIKVYLIEDGKKNLIYNKYHDYNAEIMWLNDNIVLINDIKLDLSKSETYDWRDDKTRETIKQDTVLCIER